MPLLDASLDTRLTVTISIQGHPFTLVDDDNVSTADLRTLKLKYTSKIEDAVSLGKFDSAIAFTTDVVFDDICTALNLVKLKTNWPALKDKLSGQLPEPLKRIFTALAVEVKLYEIGVELDAKGDPAYKTGLVTLGIQFMVVTGGAVTLPPILGVALTAVGLRISAGIGQP